MVSWGWFRLSTKNLFSVLTAATRLRSTRSRRCHCGLVLVLRIHTLSRRLIARDILGRGRRVTAALRWLLARLLLEGKPRV
jgi:hypothetical protein